MAATPIPRCVQVDLKMVCDGQNIQNSYYYLFPGAPNAFELNSLGTIVQTAWTTHYQDLLTDQLSLTEIVLTDLSSLAGPRVDVQVNPPVDGTAADGYAPLSVSLAIKRTGAVRGRGTTGRIFWPTLPPGEVAHDRVSPARVTAILAAVNGFDEDVVAGAPAGTISVVPHKTGVHAGTSTPLINWGVADDYVDSQRDRLPRHKRHKRRHIL